MQQAEGMQWCVNAMRPSHTGLPRADSKDQARFGRQASKLVQDSHRYHHVGISSMRMRLYVELSCLAYVLG